MVVLRWRTCWSPSPASGVCDRHALRRLSGGRRHLRCRGEIIGEASKQVHAALPWKQMAGMRNCIVHYYTGVDLAIVWEVPQNALPKLQTQLEDLVL